MTTSMYIRTRSAVSLVGGLAVLASVLCLSGGGPALGSASAHDITLGRHALYANPLAGDGKRFVSYLKPDGTPVVFDTKSANTRKIRKAVNCVPTFVGGGRVLLNCSFPRSSDGTKPSYRVGSVFGGWSHSIKGVKRGDSLDRIGSKWVAGERSSCESPTCDVNLYIKLRSGKRRLFGISRPGFMLGLDKQHLYTPHGPGAFPEGSIEAVAFTRSLGVTEHDGGLYLWRRDSKPVRIGAGIGACCLNYFFGVRVGEGVVAWFDGRTVHYVRAPSLRKTSLRLKQRVVSAVPISNGLAIAVSSGSGKELRSYKIHVIKLNK